MTDPISDHQSAWCLPDHDTRLFRGKRFAHALVIPVVNEGERIQRQIIRIQEAQLPVDVIIADGGSTDGSLDAAFLNTTVIRALLTKTGPGRLSAQLRMAYAWCLQEGYEGIITIDGNGKDNVEAVSRFVEHLRQGFDYVQGSRYCPGGQAENTPLERTIGNRLIHAPLLSLASRRWFTDTTNGFRAYSRRYLLDPRVSPFRDVFVKYELLFYLTVRAGQLGYRVCETPVRRSYPKGEAVPTKITGASANLSIIGQLFKTVLGCYNP